ncbi:MAG: type II toxin-antitoxin system VapC family toxin [Pseudomonadota bacterium]
MIFLVDTHLVLWVANEPKRLSAAARKELIDPANQLWFSAASLWEIAIKQQNSRKDFDVDARLLRRGLLDNGWTELAVSSAHGLATLDLPLLHKDPFDRMLVAQAHVEGATLLTSDRIVARYPGAIRKV